MRRRVGPRAAAAARVAWVAAAFVQFIVVVAMWGVVHIRRVAANHPWALVGVALTALSLVVAQALLVTRSDPLARELPPTVAFVSEHPLNQQPPYKGFTVRVEVTMTPRYFGNCRREQLYIQVLPKNMAATERKRYALTVISPLWYSTPEHAEQPYQYAKLDRSQSGLTLAPSNQTVDRVYNDLFYEARASGMVTTVTGWTSFQAEDRSGELFLLEVDWGQRRSFGSCYVYLPALVGETHSAAYTEAREALGIRPFMGAATAIEGATTARASGGEISPTQGDSVPPPSEPDTFTWRCALDQEASKTLVEPSGYVWSDAQARNGDTCAAVTVAVKPGLENRRLYLLFVLAGTLGLGLQMMYDSRPRRLARRPPQPPVSG